jgi:hypothetical protein
LPSEEEEGRASHPPGEMRSLPKGAHNKRKRAVHNRGLRRQKVWLVTAAGGGKRRGDHNNQPKEGRTGCRAPKRKDGNSSEGGGGGDCGGEGDGGGGNDDNVDDDDDNNNDNDNNEDDDDDDDNDSCGDVGRGCGDGDSGGEGDGGGDGCSECDGDGSDDGGCRGDGDGLRWCTDACRGGLVKGGSTWEFNSVCTYLRTMMSVFGPSMSENSDTKVSRHTKNHVAKIGLSGRK